MPQIELLTITTPGSRVAPRATWVHGRDRACAATPAAVAAALSVCEPDADAVLVFDASLPLPPAELLGDLLRGPADAWHAGLCLGLAGQPPALDHVQPLWMLNAPLDPDREATSWRLSLRALLVRRAVLDQLGAPDPGFDTLAGSALDAGMLWIRNGALVRHVPGLVPAGSPLDHPPTDADGLRLVARHHGTTWAAWAIARSVRTGTTPLRRALTLVPPLRGQAGRPRRTYQPPQRPPGSTKRSVSVVLPTIDRYDYLVPLLVQLASQTVRPHEVLVVDQTPRSRRRHDLADVVPDLAVTVFEQDEPGQSTARNRALAAASGELVLFIDDDDEIGPDLVRDHLQRLVDGIDVSSGGVDDATAGPPPAGFRHRRASDTFPTNNTMARRAALDGAGWFDPAFDRGPRADHDLGMRLHQAGALLVYDPSVMVFHHHAPAGGLRTHGARAVTRASSRRSLTQRNLPAVTQLALGHRYATARQRREGRAVTLLTTLSADGRPARRLARAFVQIVLLPSTLRRLRRAEAQAAALGPPPSPRASPGGERSDGPPAPQVAGEADGR